MLMRGIPSSSGNSLGVSDAQTGPTQAPLVRAGGDRGTQPWGLLEFGKGCGAVG